MAVGVDHHINPCQHSHNRIAAIDPGIGRTASQVGGQDHIIRALVPDFINSLLQGAWFLLRH